jgi:hypothetical protein
LLKTCNADFLGSVLDAIDSGAFVTEKPYSKKQLNKSNFPSLFLEPVSFFRWAEKQGYSLAHNVGSHVGDREEKIRIKGYQNYLISKEEVAELMHEPLWFVSCAIMYLHGFRPSDALKARYGSRTPNDLIVSSDKNMSLIDGYLYDAQEVGDVTIYRKSGSKIKPDEFMAWAGSLRRSFPNLIVEPNINEPKPLKTRERESFLKLIVGMAVEQYGYDPKSKRNEATAHIRSDLENCGISMDDETILKKLREASELLPPQSKD